jgi:hypothetical protein
MEVLQVSDRDAEPGAAPDRGGMTAFQGSKALRPPRPVSMSFGVVAGASNTAERKTDESLPQAASP